MRRICAWCGKDLGEKPGDYPDLVTHGMCQECRRWVESEIRDEPYSTTLRDYLDRFPVPVMVVSEDVQVLFANKATCDLLGKSFVQVRGMKGGEVFECAHARHPEGCGNTMHCKTCTVRRCVEETSDTGRALDRVPAYVDRAEGEEASRVRFLVSTAKIGEAILLRIDTAEEEPSVDA